MPETPNPEDELAGTEQPFVQHLMELRDRLVKAMIAIAIAAAILFFFPGPGALYDFLAAPLVSRLPVRRAQRHRGNPGCAGLQRKTADHKGRRQSTIYHHGRCQRRAEKHYAQSAQKPIFWPQ